MLTAVTLSILASLVTGQQLVSRDNKFKGIVGISEDGNTLLYNGLITKHWQKTRIDEIKIKKADVNPHDNKIYAIELESAIVYRKSSFADSFEYVDCCATAFTFVDSIIEGLPPVVKLLVVDGNTLFAKRHFNDYLIAFDIDIAVLDISSVNGEVLILSQEHRLYLATFPGELLLTDVTNFYNRKFGAMTSLNAWRSTGRFVATSDKDEVWMSTPDMTGWESFGQGRSCCVRGAFEIPNIDSFAEQSYPFCTQNNLLPFPLSSNGNCGRPESQPFGSEVYGGLSESERPCISYLSSATIIPTAQDIHSDYKIAVKGVYSYPAPRVGVAFNLRDELNFDYVYIDPENRKNCWGMGHMTPTGPVDRTDLQTGCPGGTPAYGTPFILEVQTFEGQVIVKLDGHSIFSRYPMLDNIATGGLLLWTSEGDTASFTSYGIGVCYVPNDSANNIENIFENTDMIPEEKPSVEEEEVNRSDLDPGIFAEFSSAQAEQTTWTTPPTSSSYTTGFDSGSNNNVVDPEAAAVAGIELLSGGIRYQYYVYDEPLGFTSANRACERMGMSLLLIEDEVQNSRISLLLQQEGIEQVWLGKFWIGPWEVSLYDGSYLDWKNFADFPEPSATPIFAAIRMDGFWDSVDGRSKFAYVCQIAVDVDINNPDNEFTNELGIREGDENNDIIPDSFETANMRDHPPVIIYGPVNVTAEVGDTVQFKCTASSQPPSTVIIVKIDDESQELPAKGDPSVLNDESQRVTVIVELEAVTMEDAGKYVCIAQNELGEASSPAWLIIQPTRFLVPKPTCMLWGDPHIQTYDVRNYNFPGKCSYLLTADCTRSSFWIYGLFTECGGNGVMGPSMTSLESVTVYVRMEGGNHTGVDLQRGWVVNIGGAKLRISEGMSARHDHLIIRRTSEHVFVTLPNKIVVQWDGLQMVNIQLPHDFPADRTCGLCGTNNNNPEDDFFMKDAATDYTDNENEFGNSWSLDDSWFFKCPHVPLEPVDPCDVHPDRARLAEVTCGRHLYNVPFTTCHDTVSAGVYYENCKRDVCGSEWRRDQDLPLCNSLSAYATACELAGRPISSWRSLDLCPIDEIKEITKEEGCPWDELDLDFEAGEGERDILDAP